MKNMAGMAKAMKQAQKLQSKMAEVQDEVGKKTIDVSVGGGMVSAVVNGRQELVSITIDPEALADSEMLQDMVVAAVNKGINDSKEMVQEAISKVAGGFGLPPGMF